MADEGTGEGTGEGTNSESPWAGSGLSEEQQGFVDNKGWENPGALLASYQQIETHMGVPQERLIKMPAHDDTEADWGPVWSKLGRPENADGYGDFTLPEGAAPDDNRTKAFREFAHEVGLSTKQAAALAAWDAQYGLDTAKGINEQTALKLDSELAQLNAEWGAAATINFAKADRAAAAFGLTVEDVEAMQSTWGRAKTGRFLFNIGDKMGEHVFEGGGDTTFQIMSPGQAKAAISELKTDTGFMERYMTGDPNALERMNKLQELANPKG